MPDNGYSSLYYRLLDTLTEESRLLLALLWVLPNYGAMLAIIALLLASNIIDVIGVGAITGIIIGIPILLLFVYFIVSVARVGTRRPVKTMPQLVAYILLGARRPLSDQAGLNFENVQYLERVAAIEQSAADWRGKYVIVVVIGLAALMISGLVVTMEESAEFASVRFRPILSANTNGASINVIVVILALFAIVTTWFFYRLFFYLRAYLSTELANRTILLSCEEATAFLEGKALSERSDFRFYEKRAIAEHLGCQLIPENKKTWRHKVVFPAIEDHQGNKWLLVRERKLRAKEPSPPI